MRREHLHDLYLALGTNLGDKEENMYRAIQYIGKRIGTVVSCSAFHITNPVGFESSNQFLNAVCYVKTSKSAEDVLSVTRSIECELGRNEKSVNHKYSDRIIDIDLLLFDDSIINTQDLILPHPYMHKRGFVLFLLAEIAPKLIHPILKKTVQQLKDDLQKYS